jgi:hypothetical protein
MAEQLSSGHCLRGVGRFGRMQLPCLTDTIEPNHGRPADEALPQMALPQWVMPADSEGFGGSQCREEVAAVVKFLPSLSRRLVVMRIWQACEHAEPQVLLSAMMAANRGHKQTQRKHERGVSPLALPNIERAASRTLHLGCPCSGNG